MAAVLEGDQKNPVKTSESTSLDVEDDVADLGPPEKIGTRTDHRDMLRMGKNQQLRV